MIQANSTVVTSNGQEHIELIRGCVTNVAEECGDPVCQDEAAADGTTRVRKCAYCCDLDQCNSFGLETAAAGSSFDCWNCEMDVVDGVEPQSTSCGGDDFNGEGAVKLTCQTECLVS